MPVTDQRVAQETSGASRADATRSALIAGLASLFACLAVIHTTPSEAYWTGDCGTKALVAARLVATAYREIDFDYPARSIDPAVVAFPLPDAGIPRGAGLTSIFALTYPAIAAPFLAVLGPAGLRWPAALGTAACAFLFAYWIAAVFPGRWAALGGAALGLATPLLFYGSTVWEHSLTVALSLAACVLLGQSGTKRLITAGLLLGSASWLREELVLMAFALAGAVWLRERRPRGPLLILAGASLPIAGLGIFNTLLYGGPLGPHAAAALDPRSVVALSTPTEHLRRVAALLTGQGGSPTEAFVLAGTAAVGLLASALLAWRGRALATALAIASTIGLGCWIYGVLHGLLDAPLFWIVRFNGLIAQIPLVCLAGVGVARLHRSRRWRPLRLGITAGLIFLGLAAGAGLAGHGVLGVGMHISPRKLLPALPALVALAMIALFDSPSAPARRIARLSGVALGIVGLATSGIATWLLFHQKSELAQLQRVILARPEIFVVSGDRLITQSLAGIWHTKPTLFAPSPLVTRRLTQTMRERGVQSFLVLAPEATPIATDDAHCRRVASYRGGVLGYFDTDIRSCAPRAAAAPTRSPDSP